MNDKLIILPSEDKQLTIEQEKQRMLERNMQITQSSSNLPSIQQQKEEFHRLEFIMWKSYIVCNVEIDGIWRTCSFPATTTVGEFLLSGSMFHAKNWARGRRYDNGDI